MNVLRPLIQSLPKLLHNNGPTAAFIEIDPPVVKYCLETARETMPEAEITDPPRLRRVGTLPSRPPQLTRQNVKILTNYIVLGTPSESIGAHCVRHEHPEFSPATIIRIRHRRHRARHRIMVIRRTRYRDRPPCRHLVCKRRQTRSPRLLSSSSTDMNSSQPSLP